MIWCRSLTRTDTFWSFSTPRKVAVAESRFRSLETIASLAFIPHIGSNTPALGELDIAIFRMRETGTYITYYIQKVSHSDMNENSLVRCSTFPWCIILMNIPLIGASRPSLLYIESTDYDILPAVYIYSVHARERCVDSLTQRGGEPDHDPSSWQTRLTSPWSSLNQ